jgi:hypothetical protein
LESQHCLQRNELARENELVTHAGAARPEEANEQIALADQPQRMYMRSQHVIIGVVSLVLGACARLVPPDSIVALEGPQQVNVNVGATQPLKLVATRGDGRTVKLPARTIRYSSSDTSVARVTADGRVEGRRLGRTSISASVSTPVGLVSVEPIPVAVGAVVAHK